jgi:hypothetical protein
VGKTPRLVVSPSRMSAVSGFFATRRVECFQTRPISGIKLLVSRPVLVLLVGAAGGPRLRMRLV